MIFFHVKEISMKRILMQGQAKGDFYHLIGIECFFVLYSSPCTSCLSWSMAFSFKSSFFSNCLIWLINMIYVFLSKIGCYVNTIKYLNLTNCHFYQELRKVYMHFLHFFLSLVLIVSCNGDQYFLSIVDDF